MHGVSDSESARGNRIETTNTSSNTQSANNRLSDWQSSKRYRSDYDDDDIEFGLTHILCENESSDFCERSKSDQMYTYTYSDGPVDCFGLCDVCDKSVWAKKTQRKHQSVNFDVQVYFHTQKLFHPSWILIRNNSNNLTAKKIDLTFLVNLVNIYVRHLSLLQSIFVKTNWGWHINFAETP